MFFLSVWKSFAYLVILNGNNLKNTSTIQAGSKTKVHSLHGFLTNLLTLSLGLSPAPGCRLGLVDCCTVTVPAVWRRTGELWRTFCPSTADTCESIACCCEWLAPAAFATLIPANVAAVKVDDVCGRIVVVKPGDGDVTT